ncbi:hypothetical protein GON01_03830 [Sphingomonas sp. MAH-20]|uniref:AcrB/AcrD/AcrF family protein n=1 Tax=Sphingomonas horti TaxID=2682842 RepID=A0A6I4IYU0_9SPHN|nr:MULTISPECIES: hypothetical protein [Sphingomonas]MBA2918097.1 hypothetical protein [Sphingomonas sp. CGMCC 1.13658]MVO77068.1 hypothetical protein [Sphingomonas horti]
MTPARPAPTLSLALVLTVLMTAWWAALGRADLAALRLPEPDDMMRLAQIRDWIDGQAFGDLTQARLGPPGGTAMHWSRLPDLVPALVIRLLSPLMGSARAEIAAVIFWPELLFFFHLLLSGALAKRHGAEGAALPAIALAALAFPAVALFMPGRIDHHGLQLVLVEAMALALLDRRTFLAGAVAGASLLIGVETAPVIVAAMLWLAAMWAGERRPVGGFGLGLVTAAITGLALLRPDVWPADRCDGFTRPLFAAMLIAGAGWLLLAASGKHPQERRWRLGAAAAVAVLAAAALWLVAPACIGHPYSATDPLIARIWPDHAGEYGGLLRQPIGRAVAFLGLPLIALAAAILFVARDRDRRTNWLLLAAMIAVAVATMLVQLRGAWFAAALAAPVLGQWVDRAGRHGLALLTAVWLLSAGLVWQTLGTVLDARPDPAAAGCTSRETLAGLERLDVGTFAAPMELSAYLLGGTGHRSLGGPYHRDVDGNRALAEFFLSTPDEARYQASLWTIDYVALCPTPTGGLPPALLRQGGLAAHLLNGAVPEWLEPVSLIGSDLLVWRVRGIAAPGARP